jgi:WXG100 family type VII secretion target
MPASTIRADFDQLDQIAARFGEQRDRMEQARRSVSAATQKLQDGDWVGDSANRFYAEMQDTVFPALGRLVAAFEQAQATTKAIRAVLMQAEQDVAALMPREGDGGASSGGQPSTGGTTGAADGASGGGGGVKFSPKASVSVKSDGSLSNAKLQILEGSVFKQEFFDGHLKVQEAGGAAGFGIKQDSEGRTIIGGYAEAYAAKGKLEGTMVGDKDLGWTGGVEAKALSATGFAGYRDGSLGADVGVNLVSVKGETGANIAGYNVGVSGEIGLKLELGIQVGKSTKVKLGPFTIGFSFGGAKD